MTKLTGVNIFIVLFASLGGFTYGFGFGVFVSSIGQPGFYEYFKLESKFNYTSAVHIQLIERIEGTQHTASILGAVNSLFAAGAAFGAISQGWTSDYLGRRKAIFLAAALCTVGGALTAGSVNIPMLTIVRFVQGLGLGQVVTLAPLYITEVSPASRRVF